MFNHKIQEQQDRERLRGWIIYFLYQRSPKALEIEILKHLLDKVNFPLTNRRLAKEISHLCSLRLVRVFPSDAKADIDEVEQARLVQKYSDCEKDTDMGVILCIRLTAAGTNFQEGIDQAKGIHRVE